MHEPHPVFRPPPDIDGKIWQYMELAEFVSMLHRKALFFIKANKLRDPYEGLIPQFNNNMTRGPDYNEEESAAMWNSYSHENAGIAIQSTTTKLSKCFRDNNDDTIWIGKVQYLDFSKDW